MSGPLPSRTVKALSDELAKLPKAERAKFLWNPKTVNPGTRVRGNYSHAFRQMANLVSAPTKEANATFRQYRTPLKYQAIRHKARARRAGRQYINYGPNILGSAKRQQLRDRYPDAQIISRGIRHNGRKIVADAILYLDHPQRPERSLQTHIDDFIREGQAKALDRRDEEAAEILSQYKLDLSRPSTSDWNQFVRLQLRKRGLEDYFPRPWKGFNWVD